MSKKVTPARPKTGLTSNLAKTGGSNMGSNPESSRGDSYLRLLLNSV